MFSSESNYISQSTQYAYFPCFMYLKRDKYLFYFLCNCFMLPYNLMYQGAVAILNVDMYRCSASSRIRFLPVQAQPTAARSPRGRARSSHWAIFLLNDIAITNNSTFPKIKLHYSISYCNKTKSNNLI